MHLRKPLLACTLSAVALAPVTGRAQASSSEPAPPPSTPAPYTLHVYANLIQFPTIVLDRNGEPVPALTREQFSIRLDSGPRFAPTQMHREGDEPVSLAVLLDARGSQPDLVKAFPETFAQFASTALHPGDRVSLYALDCALLRSAYAVPGNAPGLAARIHDVLDAPALRQPAGCGDPTSLWKAVIRVAAVLYASPQRRVLLVVSQGQPGTPLLDAKTARLTAGSRGIAVFALRDNNALDVITRHHASEDPLDLLCNYNGGEVLTTRPATLLDTLQKFARVLRSRYIVEFPQPDNLSEGLHDIKITVPRLNATVRSTGANAPTTDASRAADPTTVPSAASPAVAGKRRPLGPD